MALNKPLLHSGPQFLHLGDGNIILTFFSLPCRMVARMKQTSQCKSHLEILTSKTCSTKAGHFSPALVSPSVRQEATPCLSTLHIMERRALKELLLIWYTPSLDQGLHEARKRLALFQGQQEPGLQPTCEEGIPDWSDERMHEAAS